jgi:hypothetical protein
VDKTVDLHATQKKQEAYDSDYRTDAVDKLCGPLMRTAPKTAGP